MPDFAPKSAPRSGSLPFDRARLDEVCEPILRAHGAELTDVEFKSEPQGWVLRLFVEKLGSAASLADTKSAAVDLELCANVARELSPALDVIDLIPHRYHLEVSSPGIERPLKKAQDYVRFAGKKAKLKLFEAVRGQKVLVGILGPMKGDAVAVQDGGASYEIPLSNIAAARLVFEFGPAPKPGGSKPGKKKK